ncbi:hypothetical protein LPJ77_001168 [Coemansia sp. RSA 2523]|nr:hypothetical protein LPJ58_003567 [Coemansia sp. RSA 1591]KAJ1760134.1 hypothetical protein LPJ69_003521 [Coemansia sp. RSA 1752]KAJ1779692.1 hypothetical protein LPJ54_000731 [Coemansia sp. RSA 1824]KAJ1786688.1 hypothetical protein LPJ67_003476 [Coemansia sp. RSA 1938]KAJ1789064.1 hypothetical protein LPJ62_002590 [Coemansia sp. RSA 2167]KAJ1810096.1 hypothetical protein LPJ77_001168 [Coemansia sp. RSA 2523]KAJ2129391.1 hypothetical protein GGF48_002447 [Coemansia sp. RSA 921]KAJ2146864
MAGGRRRRRSSASSITQSISKSSVSSAPETQRPPPIQPPDGLTASTTSLPRLDTADDPFAYDSELETLSSVSSHSSIAGSETSELDQALSLVDEAPAEDADGDQEMTASVPIPSPPASEAGERVDSPSVCSDEARRAAAVAELTSIEIVFAQLRERLYRERVEQVQIEEDCLLAGHHAEYASSVDALACAHKQHLARLRFAHDAWVEQREKLHATWTRTVNYTYLVRRQELRRGLISAKLRRMWRGRDAHMREDRSHDTEALDTRRAGDVLQMRHARRCAKTAQRCMVRARTQPMATAGLDDAEMDSDYAAMNLPVLPRSRRPGFRRLFVPSFAEPALPPKKRKPRQPKKKPAGDAQGASRGASEVRVVQHPAVSAPRLPLPPVAEDPVLVPADAPNTSDIRVPPGLKV